MLNMRCPSSMRTLCSLLSQHVNLAASAFKGEQVRPMKRRSCVICFSINGSHQFPVDNFGCKTKLSYYECTSSPTRLTSSVRSAKLQRTVSVAGNQVNRICSADAAKESRPSTMEWKGRDSWTSLKRKAGSTSIWTDSMIPVAPRPHRVAKKRSGCSVLEQDMREPSANIRVTAMTCVGITP